MRKRETRIKGMPRDTTYHDARSAGKEYRSQELAEINRTVKIPSKPPLVTTKERS